MSEEITIDSLLPRLKKEVQICDHGEVTLTVAIYRGRIVKWGVTRSYTSKVVEVPTGAEEKDL